MENRHGLLVDLQIARGNESERAASLGMLENHVDGPATVAGDRGYAPQRSMRGPRDTMASESVSASENESRRSLAG